MENEMKIISRKVFLKKMGTTLAGVALFGGMGSILTGCSEEELAEATSQMGLDAVEYPVPYVRIDPDKAAERAYKYYKEKGG